MRQQNCLIFEILIDFVELERTQDIIADTPYEASNEDSSKDSNQDSNEDDFVEGITQEKCGSFNDFDECVARQTMEALKNVIP